MQLQALKKKIAYGIEETGTKTVAVFLQASYGRLTGAWHWELNTDAVFCSDVMAAFPQDFAGTKAIFHPDDLAFVKEQLSANGPVAYLQFRIITTYGEVKTLTGKNIRLEAEELQQPRVETLSKCEGEWQAKKEREHLQTMQQVFMQNAATTGIWYYNAATGKTWFDDAIFLLHGLPPQSLNSHLHIFHPFLHPDDRDTVLDYTDKALQEKAPLHLEYRVLVNEKQKWIQYTAGWHFNEKGEEIFGGVLQDITEYKTVEAETETWKGVADFQRQQALYDERQLNIGHWQVNLLTRKATFSDQYFRIFGIKPQSLSAQINTFLHYIHPDDQDLVEAANKKIINEHTGPEIMFRIQRSDGKLRYVRQTAKLIMSDGALVMAGLLEDITVQQMLENRLAGLSAQLLSKNLQQQQYDEAGALGSWVMEVDTDSIIWSDGMYRFLGYKTAAVPMTQKTFCSFIHPHDVKEFKERWNAAVHQKKDAIFRFRLMLRGAVRYMNAIFRIHTDGDKKIFIGTIQDISTEHFLQEHLSQRVQLAESLTENILDRVMITDEHHTIVLWNKAAEKAYGQKKEAVIGQNFFDVFPHLKTEAEMHNFSKVLRGEKVVETAKASQTGNGYYNLYLMPLWKEKEVTGMLHIVHDVTKETELRQSLEDRLLFIQSLVDSSVDRIIALDKHMTYLYWNGGAEKHYALRKEDVLGKNILDVFPQMVNDPSFGEFRKALRGETIHIPANVQKKKLFETYLVPVRGGKNEITGVLWIAHDLSKELALIDQQQKAQEELRQEHRRLKEAQAVGLIGSFEWTVGSAKSQWSDELYRINGLEPGSEDPDADIAHRFIHPDDRASFLKEQEASLKTPGRYGLVHRIVVNGEEKWINHQWESVAGEEGKVVKVMGIVQDITERKKSEQVLHESKDMLQLVFDTSFTGIAVFAALRNEAGRIYDFEYRLANSVIENYAGRPVIGEKYFELFPGVKEAGLSAALIAVAETGTPADLEIHYEQDGYKNWFRITAMKFGDGLISSVEDITARKLADEEIKKNVAILQQAEELAQMGSWDYDIATGAFSWSKGMYDLFGLPKELNVRPEIYLEYAADEDRHIAKSIIKSFRKTHQPINETLHIQRNNRRRLLKIKSSIVRNAAGDAQRIIGVDVDITDIKEAEEKLQESRRWLEQTAHASPDSITVYDFQKKHPVYLNDCLAGWTGKTPEELVAMGIEGRLKLVYPDDRLRLLQFNDKLAGAKDDDMLTMEYRILKADGNYLWLRNRSKVFQRDEAGRVTHLLSILQDISDQKLSEQLLTSLNASLEKQNKELESKNEEITSFAFVASHDLKEPIRKLHTFTDWLMTRELLVSDAGKTHLQKMAGAIRRLDTLIDEIMALSRAHLADNEKKKVDLNSVLGKVQEELAAEIEQKAVQLKIDTLPTITGDENLLFSLFLNLIGNSIKFQLKDAVPKISISWQATRDEKEKGVRIYITDNGIGFTQAYSKKIFLIFQRLNNREDYDGTGMGLAICKKIMEKHGGTISVVSEPGKGSTFSCWFPVV